jgi:hypothetical protein
VKQLTGQGVFDESCGGAVICVLATLPHIVDSGKAGREKYLEVLADAAKALRKSPVRYEEARGVVEGRAGAWASGRWHCG